MKEPDPYQDKEVKADTEQTVTNARPKKQRFANLEKVYEAEDFAKLSEQKYEMHVGTNRAGESFERKTKQRWKMCEVADEDIPRTLLA